MMLIVVLREVRQHGLKLEYEVIYNKSTAERILGVQYIQKNCPFYDDGLTQLI
jgi:hypothetical protein